MMKGETMAARRGGAEELRILEAQLDRMRGMLSAYSGLFFRQITIWGVVSLLLLALSGLSTGAPVGVLLLFVVPFAFLEAGYTFYYTVFARRHADEPDAPKLSFLSFGRLSGYGSVMTIGYSIAALLLWGAGFDEGLAQVAAGGMHVGVLAAGVLWTLGVTLYLLWHFLSRRDEERLLAALRVAYPDAVVSRGRARSGR